MSIARLDFLDREAALYKNARNKVEETSDFIQNQIDIGTKIEQEKVESAIKELNSKVQTIIDSKEVKEKEDLIKEQNEIIKKSIKVGFETYKKICKIIDEKPNLTLKQRNEYKKKLYEKLMDKFMTEKEKELFANLINMKGMPIVIMGGPNGQMGGGMRSLGF
jgi:hypothetical protein